MAETEETATNAIDISQVAEEKVPQQNNQQQSSIPTQASATVPTVSDINFEDIADMIGNSPGDLAKLQLVDPVFEGMLMQAALPINAAPPITGSKSMNNFNPGKATQHYNPYESSTPPNLNTLEGKKKFLQQGLYDDMVNPKVQKAPGYIPDIEFGIKETNFDRYYAFDDLYDELGFHPFRNNEEIYNANSTFHDEFARTWGQTSKILSTAFTSNYRNMSAWMGIIDDENMDKNGALEYADAIRIGSSSKGGFGGFTNRLVLNSSYTAGIIANIAVEEAVLAALTAKSFGGTAPLLAARTAQNIGRLTKLKNTVKDIGGVFKSNIMDRSRISAGRQLLTDLNKVENARQFFRATGTGALNFIAPSTMASIKTLNSSKGVVRGIQNFKDGAKVFGGFYRDVRQLSMAVAEGKLEAGFVYNNMVDSLYHDYVAEYGDSPPMEKLDEIKQKATAASMKTLYFNVPLIYLSNRIVFSTLFQGMGGLARLTQRHQTGLGKRIFINSKATAKSSANAAKAGKVGDRILYDGGNTFLGRVKNLGVKGNFGAMGAMALRYTGANFAEGIQELSQEIISKSAQDYYTGLFLDKGYTQSNLLESSIKNAIDAQISPQGFEVFMSGFLMGGLVQPVQQGFMVGLPSIYQWGKGTYGSEQSKAKYQEYSKNKEEFITKTIDNQNKLLEDVFSVFDPAKLNAAEQKQLNERLLQSSYSSDMLSFMDDKDHSKFSQLDYLFKTGNSNQFKQILKDWQKLTDEELIEGWPEYKKEIKANKFREKLQKFDKKIDEFQEGWDTVQDKYVNPYDPTQFSSGSLEYNSEALRYIAYDHAKKLFMYSQDTFKRSLERSNSIFERLGSDSAISNMKSSDISILLELKTLKTEIENLQSEIAIGSTTSEQQELIEKKKAKLNILQKYLNVITDPKNFTKTSKDNIPLEMKGDLVTTKEDGEDVVTIGNQKYKATRKITSEVGTFDRRKINTLRGPFFEYINFLAEENGEFIRTTDLDEILKDIVDYKFLEGRAQSYFRAIEILSDPEILLDSAKRIADRLKIVYNKHKEDVEKTVKKHVSDLEKNELINQLASQLIYPDATQVVLFFKEGIVPTIFHMESGQITPQDNPAKWDSIQNLIKAYLNRPGEETNVKPGETINEEELEDAKINDIVKRVDTEITDATKDVLIAKWKSYVQSKIGKEGAVLSWEQWQTSKSAKNIKNIRAKLNTIYLSTLTTEQQKEKSFDKWLSEEQRTPEIYRILNSEGGSYSDYIVTDSESVNTEKLNNLDKLVGESLSGINILKRKVPTQSQDDKEEYYYEIVDNDMNNLYNEYSQNDPNGNIIKDTYKTQGEAIGAQQMIVGLQPNNSKFGPNNEYHYRQILQDNNNNQFVVITTPKTFAKGGKLYLRPLEFANDKNKSFEVVDVENYKPLDFTNFKAETKNQDILLLRQSEPIKLYAHRHDGESSEQAEVRLSERLRDLTPEEVNNLQLKVSNNPDWNNFETKKQDPDSLSPIGSKTYTNPNIKTGSEELTVAVINGREVLGYLQGPTGAVIVIDGKIINPLTLTEDNVDEYYKIYDTNKTQLKTKAEQLEIIKNNYASSIILNDKLKQLLGGDQEIIVPINKIKGLNLRVSPGKITYAPKGQGVTFSELVANTIDGKNFWITDNRSDGKGGIITNITEENIYAKAEALVNAASEQTSYNPLYTKSRYVAAVRLPNGTFTFIELKAGELSNDTKNELVIRILNEQDEVLVNNIDQENDEVKDEAATFTFNDELKNDFYIFGKTNEFIDIELTSRGDIQVIYRNTAKINKDGQALRISYTINENDVKGITKSINPFNTFLEIINTKIKFKDASLDVPSNLVLTSDNFRKSIPKSATVQDLASAVTNFQKGIRNNIRIEAVITDAAQINNIKNTSQLPSFIGNNVQQQINNTDQIIVNAEIESPELTAEYMRNLHKDKFQNVEVATIKLIARKLATKPELSPAENTINTNTFNTDVGGNIDLLKLTYQSGVIQEGGATNVDVTTVKTSIEKTPSRKIADQINELEKQIETLEDNIFNDTYNSIVSPTGTTDIDTETDTEADIERRRQEELNINEINISDIYQDGEEENVEGARQNIIKKGKIENNNPIIVSKPNEIKGYPATHKYNIEDGFHRVANAVDSGKTEINAVWSEDDIIKINAKYDAELAALGTTAGPVLTTSTPTSDTKRKANIAANEAIENSQELKNLENQVKELKKKLAPKVINKLTTENIEQIDQFTTWVKQNLPDFIQVQDIQDLSARLKENGKTVGMFTLELNAISNNIEGNIYVGTQTAFKYHEAFHGIFRMLLTETEIKKYLAIAKKEKLNELRKQGTTLAKALYELKSSHSIYNNLNKKELEERLYEEYLADKFDLFKMNPGKTETSSEFKSLFTKIIEWIKAVINRFSKNELTSLFKNIDAGKYKTSTVQLNRFTTEGLETGITSSAPKVIAIDSYENVYTDPFTGKEIVSLSSVYMPAVDQRKMIATIAALYKSYVDRGDLLIMSKRAVLDTAIRDYSRVLNPKREYYTSEQNGIEFRSIRKKLNLYYKALRTNSNVIAENVSKYLEIFDTKFQIEQEAFEENYHDENTNVRKVDEYGKNANQIGGEKSLSTELRQFIATTILEEQDLFGNKETLDGIPIVTTVDFHFAYSGLLKALSDKTNDLQMLQALATFSSTNANTAAVANNIFTRIGINDPLTLLDEEQLPKITDPNFLQKVIKGFNQFRLDYMFAHKDIDSGLVFIYEANKKDDANSQINYWSNTYDSLYPALLTNEGKQKVTSLLNLFKSKILNPKDRSRKQLIEESQSISKNIYDQIGIYLNATTIEYSILSSKPVRKNWEEAIVSLGLSAGVESITPDDIEEMRLSITRGENIFLDNQTEIPLTKEEEQNTPEEIKSNTGISSRLKKMAKTNSVFDETVGATVFRDPKGNFIYAHQMPTFHLVKVAEMKEKDWVENKIKENEFFSKNYLLNNSKFKAQAAAGKLKITRFIGSKEGKVTESENGSVIENRGLNVNQQDGVSYGESSSAEFIADVINSYIYNYNRNNQTIPLNSYTDKDGKNSQYIEAPAILKVLSDASTSDFVNFPIDKMVTLNENGETILTDHTLDALIYNMLQTEYNRVRNELDPEKAELDTIEGFNTGSNRGTKFVRTKGFITKRKSKVKVLSGVTTPMMSEVTKTNIVNNNQRIILRSGQAQSAIGLDVGQQTPITIGYMVGDEKKYKQFVLKNKGLVSVNNIDINKYIKYLGDSVSTKPIIDKKKQNVLNIGTIPFYFQRSEDMKFFDGKIEQYVYEFIPLEEANIEVGYEEKTTQPSTSVEGLEVINEEPVFFEVNNFIEENLIIAANEGLNFDEAVKRIGEDKLKEIIENRIFTDFYDFKRTLINSRAISKLSVEITDGLGTIIRPQKGKKGTPYYQVTNKGREAMKLFNLKENNVDYNLAQIFMHQYINARSMNDLMLGDHALLFESFSKESKLSKMQNNAGPSTASPLVAPELGINHTFNSNNSIQLLTYHDPKTLKRFSDGTFSDLDGQLFGTVKAFKHLWFGVNGLSPAMADLLSKIEKNEEISADDFWGNKKLGIEGYKSLGAVLNSKKFVYGDGQTNLKISFLPLIPQLTSYIDEFGEWQPLPQMEFLHNLRVKLEEMEVGTESVSIAVPVSGSKMMKKNVITVDEMFNNESIKTIQERYKDRNGNNTNIITGLHPKWMRLQVANPSGSVSGIDPRQMKQLVTTEQTDIVDVVINGKSYSIKEIKEAYHSSISNQVILRYRNKRNLIFNLETALDEIGNSIDSGKITANLSAFLNYATPALEASQAKTQKLEFFSFDEVGNPKYDLNNSITIDDFIKLFLSFFSKGVLSGNQPEVTVALVSSYGVKPMRIVKKLDENGQPIDTEIIRIATWKNLKNKPKIADKFIEGENGKPGKWVDLKVGDVILQELQHNVYDPESKTYYSEFMMPAHFRELSKFIKPGDIIPYPVAVALGIRIPSQDKHSAMSLRLVDFLPDVYGSSAMFAKELIEISGADFDIDKLYAHIKQWYYSKGKFNEYGKAKTDKGRYAEYIRFIISDVNKKGSGISDAVIKWSTNNSAFLNEEEVENLQDELARKTASELTININLFKNTYSAKVISYILELNDEITDEQVIKLYNKNEDLYGALQSLGLPVTFKEYNDYIKKHKGAEPYEAAINNDILDQRIALIANDGIIKPKNKRKVGIGNEPADLQPLNEIKEFLKSTFPELADFANPEDIDPDNMLGLFETWSSIKNGEGGIGAAVRPNIVLNMLAENKIKIRSNIVSGVETNSQIRFNKITFDTFGTEYSQDGKTNDTAVRTQYLISSLITMMTDNAKERLADVLSINKSSLAVVTTWSSLGVPIKTSILMLKNPAIKLGYDLAINKATPISPGITTILSNRMAYLKKDFDISNESVTDQILIDQINNDWLNISEPLTTGFGENITGQIPKEYTDKEASIEYAILKQFVIARTLTDYTAKLGSLTDLLSGFGRDTSKIDQTNQDFKDLGIGLSDIEFNKLKTRDGSPIPIDVRSLFKSNDFRATYYTIFKEVENLLPVVFITRTPNFIKIKDTVVANMIQNNMFVSPERVNVIEKDILSYLTITTYKQFLLNSENGLEKLASLQNGLIYDEEGGKNVTTISEVVKNIQSYFRDKGQENYFINKFVSLDLATSDTNKSGINRLKANNWSKISDSKAVELQVSFAEIYSEPALRIYAYDLIHYLLVKDGMQFKNNSFLNAVPAFMFDRILSSISTGHSILKSKTSTTANYSLVFGKSSEELANDFVHGYLLSNQNNWLLPTIKNIEKEETKPVHINKEGDLIINLFQGIKRFINKKGENVIKGKKYKFTVEGKSIFVNQKSKEYSVLAKNIGYLSNKGFTFNTVIDGNKKYLEIIFPLYIKNTYFDGFKNSYSKTFELQETGREKRFSKSGDIMNMLDDEDLTAKGYQAVYKEVEPVGSNQVTPISFVFGNVPTYKSIREKYKSDPIDALVKSIDLNNIDAQVNAIFNNLDTSEIQALYNKANISGSEIKTTNKTVTINNESIDTNPEIIDNFDNIDIATESKSIIDSQIAATENMLKLLNVKKENSSKSDLELKAINDWWNSLDSTDKFKAQKATKRSGIDGILNEFNTFDGTAERFIDIIKNCT